MIELTREDATELFIALNTAEAGFTPANVVAAADNLNTLKPCVSALDKGKNAFMRETRRVNREVAHIKLSRIDADEKLQQLADDLAVKGDEVVKLELLSIELTPDEVAASKIKPAAVAILRRWLLPKK
jgi:hypothetical protein